MHNFFFYFCAVPKNILTGTPLSEGIGVSWGVGGFCKAKKFKDMYEAQLEFPEWWESLKKNPFREGGMVIFQNYSMCVALQKS